jgi:ABC-type multidrug transport system fused ATPase/permease subunit
MDEDSREPECLELNHKIGESLTEIDNPEDSREPECLKLNHNTGESLTEIDNPGFELPTYDDVVCEAPAENSAPNNGHVTTNGGAHQPTADTETDSPGPNKTKIATKLRSILKRDKEKQNTVPIRQLFRFATKVDVILMSVATLCSLAHGVGMPLLLVIFGDVTTLFVKYSGPLYPNGTIGEMSDESKAGLMHDMRIKAGAFAGIGGAVLFVAYAQVAFWLIAAHRQTLKIRVAMLSAVLRQDIGWFDTHDSGGLSTRLSDDVNKIQEGIGDKVGGFFQWIATAISGIIIALVKGWKLALVLFAFTPIIAICGAVMMYLTTASTNKELTAYAKAGSVASEVFGAIRTVFMFGGQEKECARYSKNLVDARRSGIIKSMITGGGIGMTYFVLFSSYCLAFWYGGKLVGNEEYQVGDMLIIFFCVIFGSMALGNASPNLQSVGVSRGAAYFIYELIDRQPPIDSRSPAGLCPAELTGNIQLKDVKFHYPSRPEVPILQGLSLSIVRGQTVALVGGSGCGKSTVIQLIQRFYDPLDGIVAIDGIDIKLLNVKWLRQHTGVVSQEPVLFALSIAENIRYGRDGITDADIERAAREANAHDFIAQLPQKYETLVGERGAQLSGGQKQRIAIARALVRDPKILLLDEATSALDTESEATVQAALDKARLGRTTIIVAHRLSTIKTADVIYGIKDGVVHEYGTHDELMARGGIYHQLVTNQQTDYKDADQESSDDAIVSDKVALEESVSTIRRAKNHETFSEFAFAENESKLQQDIGGHANRAKLRQVRMAQLMHYNSPEWFFILIGCIFSVIHGGLQPIVAILIGEILHVSFTFAASQFRNFSS